jgi:hypothetical protein
MKGKRLQVVIEEDGTETPPILPPATVVRRLVGPDENVYHLVRLDQTVTCRRAVTGKDWTLSELVIAPAFQGTSLESELPLHPAGMRVPVGIANVVAPLEKTTKYLDFARVVYFALGWIGEIQGETP